MIYIKYNDWNNISIWDKCIKLTMTFVVSFMSFLFFISGLRGLLYGLFHAIMFGIAFIILIVLTLSILRKIFQPSKS
jgi:uncharacterized membrane protein